MSEQQWEAVQSSHAVGDFDIINTSGVEVAIRLTPADAEHIVSLHNGAVRPLAAPARSPLNVDCEDCGAPEGKPCKGPGIGYHDARHDAAPFATPPTTDRAADGRDGGDTPAVAIAVPQQNGISEYLSGLMRRAGMAATPKGECDEDFGYPGSQPHAPHDWDALVQDRQEAPWREETFRCPGVPATPDADDAETTEMSRLEKGAGEAERVARVLRHIADKMLADIDEEGYVLRDRITNWSGALHGAADLLATPPTTDRAADGRDGGVR